MMHNGERDALHLLINQSSVTGRRRRRRSPPLSTLFSADPTVSYLKTCSHNIKQGERVGALFGHPQ